MPRQPWFRKKYEHELILSKHQKEGFFSYILVLDHLKASFNVAKTIRTANALGCREVHLVGIRIFDPSPAKGTLKQTKTRSFERIEESFTWLKEDGYTIYALSADAPENETVELSQAEFPKKSAFVLGAEEFGLSFNPEEVSGVTPLKIRQYGQVQSLNVSVAAALCAYEYGRQWQKRE